MNLRLVENIASAVLYEGYLLYPYRRSAIKNRQRFNFGIVYPRNYGLAHNEPWSMQTECLVMGDEQTRIEVRVRFLQLLSRVKSGEQLGWHEAVEREVVFLPRNLGCHESSGERMPYEFPREVKSDNGVERRQEEINGQIEIAAEQVAERLYRFTVRILNLTSFEPASQSDTDSLNEANEARAEMMLHVLASTHTILNVRGGEFVSLLDPADEWREAAAACRNIGTYPVLVGEDGERDCLLSSPIILYDYPQIAPESAGDLFDGTEIDEILTLRILTLTDDEKREMRETGELARQILERSEALPAERLLKMHGALRGGKAGGENE